MEVIISRNWTLTEQQNPPSSNPAGLNWVVCKFGSTPPPRLAPLTKPDAPEPCLQVAPGPGQEPLQRAEQHTDAPINVCRADDSVGWFQVLTVIFSIARPSKTLLEPYTHFLPFPLILPQVTSSRNWGKTFSVGINGILFLMEYKMIIIPVNF